MTFYQSKNSFFFPFLPRSSSERKHVQEIVATDMNILPDGILTKEKDHKFRYVSEGETRLSNGGGSNNYSEAIICVCSSIDTVSKKFFMFM